MNSNAATFSVPAPKLTAWFALWLILGYVLAQYAGFFLVNLAWTFVSSLHSGVHAVQRAEPAQPGVNALAWAVTTGMVLGAAWVTAFSWHRARPWLHQPDSRGVAWRQPSRRDAYVFAVFLAGALVALVGGVEKLLPPDPSQLTGPMQQLSTSHGFARVLFVVAAVGFAPVLEEFIFRGAAFAALAHSFGTVAAVVVTTLAFVILHAADKIHYWPGFFLVGCLALAAVFLRLRFRSLWPGILLHATYNGLLILLS